MARSAPKARRRCRHDRGLRRVWRGRRGEERPTQGRPARETDPQWCRTTGLYSGFVEQVRGHSTGVRAHDLEAITQAYGLEIDAHPAAVCEEVNAGDQKGTDGGQRAGQNQSLTSGRRASARQLALHFVLSYNTNSRTMNCFFGSLCAGWGSKE
jgi:hypothetical protein